MATKKSTKAVKTVNVKDAAVIHSNRHTETATNLIIAKISLQNKADQLLQMIANIDECLHKFTLAQLQAEVGANTQLCVDGVTNIVFSEKMVTTGTYNAKAFNTAVGDALFPNQYKKSRVDWTPDTTKMYKDYLDGCLPSILMPYVSASRDNVVKIDQRAARGTSGPAKTGTVTPTATGTATSGGAE